MVFGCACFLWVVQAGTHAYCSRPFLDATFAHTFPMFTLPLHTQSPTFPHILPMFTVPLCTKPLLRSLGGDLYDDILSQSPPLEEWRRFVYCETVTGAPLGVVDHFPVRGEKARGCGGNN